MVSRPAHPTCEAFPQKVSTEFFVAKVDVFGRVRRWTRAMQVLVVLAGVASCSDRAGMGPIALGHARLDLAPRFATVAGAPAVPLSRIEGTITSSTGAKTVEKANFVDGSASLTFDILLSGTESSTYTLDLVGFDVNDVEAYRAHQTYTLKAGPNDNLQQPVLQYSGPDAQLVALHFDPGSMTLDPGATTKITVTGTGANNAPISTVRVGWTSRNTSVATVDEAGNVIAGQVKGQTYIVARTPANFADSLLVTTRGAIAAIIPTPTSISLFRGATATMSAEVHDPSGTVITDRAPAFTSSDEKVATVTAAGVVTGVAVGSTSINAAVGGKSASVPVTVTSPVAGVQIASPTVTLTNIGDSQLLTATVLAKEGASVAGVTPAFTTSDATVATVGTEGRVTAAGYGSATITATIESFTATTLVVVKGPLAVTPATPTIFTNATQQFSVTAGGKGPFAWSVDGVSGGNATVGLISATGSYKAPAQIPTLASFKVCAIQVSPSTDGCTTVTLASPVAGIQLAPPTVTLANIGNVQQLTATIVPKTGASVAGLTPTFTTSDGSVATVSADGRVTAAGYGTATITATIETFAATTTVVVGPIVVAPATPTVFTNATQQFSVTSGGGPFTWKVNGVAGGNTTVGQISATGSYSPPAQVPTPASVEICATQASPSTKGCTTVTVASPVGGIQLAPPVVTFTNLGDSQLLTATILPKPGASVVGLTPTFTTSNGGVATVAPDGRVTAAGYGTATITATIETFAATTTVNVNVPGPLVLAPATPTVLTNVTQQFSVTSGGTGPFTWSVNGVTGGNATVGTISGTGSYRAPAQVPNPSGVDVCAVQASPSTKGCTHVSVESSVAGIQLAPPTVTLQNIGDSYVLTPAIIPKAGGSVVGLTPTFTTSDASVATVGTDGRVTATGWGIATITAKIETFATTTSVSVVGPLVLSPATANKFPNGTQQYTVSSGGKGPFTWKVNGVAGGNATYGTITAAGFYTAPATTPSLATFQICASQAVPQAPDGCATMTINTLPPGGADLVVFNDLNMFDATALQDANNQTLIGNLVSFTGTGARASQTRMMLYLGHASFSPPNLALFGSYAVPNYTVTAVTTASLTSIPASYKVIAIWAPTVAFSTAEINALKQFAAEGGRIIFLGESADVYAGIAVENSFLSNMGAQMTNAGGSYECAASPQPYPVIPGSQLVTTNQIMSGLTQLTVNCASEILPGPNDSVLFRSTDGTHVLGGVAKISLTPLP
jgi:hypothetical protein